MSIFVIGDLHLSFNNNKPMDIFGENWKNHEQKIKKDWLEKVKPEDTVILLGDFSWAMYIEETKEDFTYLKNLPGKKLLVKGNHDYWWTTLKSMKNFLENNNFSDIDFIYNKAFLVENKIIVGSRGWSLNDESQDKKLIKREAIRLELSIKDGISKFGTEKEIIPFIHYPPIIKSNIIKNVKSEFIEVIKKYNIKRCYYAHLHSLAINDAIQGEYFGIDFKLVSADYLNFSLQKVC